MNVLVDKVAIVTGASSGIGRADATGTALRVDGGVSVSRAAAS